MVEQAAALITRSATRRRFFGLLNIALGTLAVSLTAPPSARAAGRPPQKWVCTDADCDPYVYDPARGDADNIADPGQPIPAGIRFEELPDDWICPICGSGKTFFRPLKA